MFLSLSAAAAQLNDDEPPGPRLHWPENLPQPDLVWGKEVSLGSPKKGAGFIHSETLWNRRAERAGRRNFEVRFLFRFHSAAACGHRCRLVCGGRELALGAPLFSAELWLIDLESIDDVGGEWIVLRGSKCLRNMVWIVTEKSGFYWLNWAMLGPRKFQELTRLQSVSVNIWKWHPMAVFFVWV